MAGNGLLGMAALAAILFLSGRKAEASTGSGNGDISPGEAAFDVLLPDDYAPPSSGDFSDSGVLVNMFLSNDGLELLKGFEGFAPTKYFDHKGYSIGYGHLIKSGEEFTEPMSEDFAAQLLAQDVEWAEDAVNNGVRVVLNQNQFDALVSLVYNIGAGAFANSTLLRKLNSGDASAAQEFARWNRASGAVLPALVTRRAAETELFLA